MTDVKKSIIDSIVDIIEKAFGDVSGEKPVVEFTKSLDLEQRRALFVVLEPQELDNVSDLHGDFYTAEEIEKACISFNTHSMKANLFHRVETEHARIEQSYINLTDFISDDGRLVKKGSWLQWWYFPEDDSVADRLWEMVKAGEINGVSIGANAKVEAIE